MSRNLWLEGITLHCRRVQDFHKSVIFLSREGGIREAILHGGYKGKSRHAAGTEPFRHVKLLLYHNPVKDSWKISDGDVLDSFEGFRQDLCRIYMATLWGEILMKTSGGGSSGFEADTLFSLTLSALEALEKLPREKLPRLNTQYLWRFLGCIGFAVDFSSCASCGRALASQERVFFHAGENGFFCESCDSGAPGHGFKSGLADKTGLSSGVVRYLEFSLSRGLSEGLRGDLPAETLMILERIPLGFLRSEMNIHPRTPDYRQFL